MARPPLTGLFGIDPDEAGLRREFPALALGKARALREALAGSGKVTVVVEG